MSTFTERMGTFAPYVLSILRIVTALLFLQHGLSKVFSSPVPGPPLHGLLLLAAFLETVGSLLLLVGAYTRIVAFIRRDGLRLLHGTCAAFFLPARQWRRTCDPVLLHLPLYRV